MAAADSTMSRSCVLWLEPCAAGDMKQGVARLHALQQRNSAFGLGSWRDGSRRRSSDGEHMAMAPTAMKTAQERRNDLKTGAKADSRV